MDDHQRSFNNLMYTCTNLSKTDDAIKIFKPTDLEKMRLDRQHDKTKEAYRIIDDQIEITDLNFSNRLFIYHNEQMDH